MWWMRVCIGQYVLVRPLSTLASVIGEATGAAASLFALLPHRAHH